MQHHLKMVRKIRVLWIFFRSVFFDVVFFVCFFFIFLNYARSGTVCYLGMSRADFM